MPSPVGEPYVEGIWILHTGIYFDKKENFARAVGDVGPYGLEEILNFANRNLPCNIFCSVKREDTVLPYEFVILLYRAYRNYRCKNDGFIKIG